MELSLKAGPARKLKSAARSTARQLPADLPPVLVFTDPIRSAHPLDLASILPPGWGLIYRHFGAADARPLAEILAQMAKKRRFRLLIGADPKLARAVKADGVHWPDHMWATARHAAPAFHLNTMSAHTASDLYTPQPAWLDARVLSTIFPSSSPSAGVALGAIRARNISRRAHLPVYALGGVTSETAGAVANQFGLAGVGKLRD
ncbi:MAG: thiamine phosphate synthase [Hyphomonadaceae bacterium]|nr:thiamine phosphate synthase [Hyphomonadaceae bacterium]